MADLSLLARYEQLPEPLADHVMIIITDMLATDELADRCGSVAFAVKRAYT